MSAPFLLEILELKIEGYLYYRIYIYPENGNHTCQTGQVVCELHLITQ